MYEVHPFRFGTLKGVAGIHDAKLFAVAGDQADLIFGDALVHWRTLVLGASSGVASLDGSVSTVALEGARAGKVRA